MVVSAVRPSMGGDKPRPYGHGAEFAGKIVKTNVGEGFMPSRKTLIHAHH